MSNNSLRKASLLFKDADKLLHSGSYCEDQKDFINICDDVRSINSDLHDLIIEAYEEINSLEQKIDFITRNSDLKYLLKQSHEKVIYINHDDYTFLNLFSDNKPENLGLRFLGFDAEDSKYIFSIIDEQKWCFHTLKNSF